MQLAHMTRSRMGVPVVSDPITTGVCVTGFFQVGRSVTMRQVLSVVRR